MASGTAAAAAGGFTGVLLMPSTHPPLQNKADIEFIIKCSELTPVDVYPAGALSRDLKGKDITEMYDMSQAGALAFTDDRIPVSDSGMMLRALQYCKNIGSVVITYSNDPGIVGNGNVNENEIESWYSVRHNHIYKSIHIQFCFIVIVDNFAINIDCC